MGLVHARPNHNRVPKIESPGKPIFTGYAYFHDTGNRGRRNGLFPQCLIPCTSLCTPKALFNADNAVSNYPLTFLILRMSKMC